MMDRSVHSRASARAGGCLRGVTLIELLAVVAIVALLIAILLPSLAAARQRARRMSCGSNLRAVGQALNLYKTAVGRYPIPGERDPYRIYGRSWKPGNPIQYRSAAKLSDIGDLGEALVSMSLGDPWAMYCPSSLQTDRYAPRPYLKTNGSGQVVATWRLGNISYMYLVGLDPTQPESRFPDAQGQPTFNPTTESPERRVNRVNPRTVLIGDRVVELVPPACNIAGSNHGREGGWFFFTSGDAQWWGWERLTAHPTSRYLWYWPRLGRSVGAMN